AVDIEGWVAAPTNPNAMTQEQNRIAGVNLAHLYSYDLTFSDPSGGWQYPYMPGTAVGTIKANYLAGGTYATALNNSVGTDGQKILAMWSNGSSAIDSQILAPLIGTANYFIYSLVWGDGVRDICCEYVQGTYITGPSQISLSTALPDSS